MAERDAANLTNMNVVNPSTADRTTEPTVPRDRSAWRHFVWVSGWVVTVGTGVVSAFLGDLEGATVAAALGASTWLTRIKSGIVGAICLATVSAVTLIFMSTAAVTNIRAGSALDAIVISAGLSGASLLGLAAGIGFLLPRGTRPRLIQRATVGSACLLAVGMLAWGLFSSPSGGEGADIRLVAENMRFSETRLTANPGMMTVMLGNDDLFWHTFTIEELDVDLRVPVGGELQVTFEANPGTYEFICTVPGHPEAGMVGTLEVEG